MPDLLSIGASALSAAQVGIAVTGNNISNASTPGYSRQTVLQTASPSQNYAFGYIGEGTTVSSVQRVYDQTLGKQLNDATSASNASSAYYTQISNVNNLISNSTSGLSTSMTNFFSAMSASAASPTDSATRQTVLSSAQSLANSFNAINQSLGQINIGINSQISSSVSTINSYSSQLASLNTQIVAAQSSSTNPPNDLLDQRDQLVNQLSQNVQTSVVKQTDGSYSVFIGNGIPLVVGQQTYTLGTAPSSTDPQSLDITYGSTTNPTILNANNVSGGSLGGLLQFRSETLQPVQNQVGQLAVSFASSYNSQLANGYDLNGNAGTNLFNVPAPVTISSSNNTDPTKAATATIVDATKITSSDYTLKYSSGQYSITRSGDNQVVWQGATLPATVDGLQINVNTSSPTNGDTYLIEPTRNAAGLISVSMTDPSKLALSGSATAGSNDNTNALALQALQNAATVATTGSSSSQSFTQAFSQLSSNVGSKTNEMNITNQANTSALNSATTAVQSNSGVNLDEEATNLLRYQQAYQAAGKMMQIASTLFNTLLQISP